jgi:hypothetical protein
MMGKAGIQIVVHSLITEGVGQDQAVEVAAYLLRDYRFIYEAPDDEVRCSLALQPFLSLLF